MEAKDLRIGNLLENFLGQEFKVNHETLRMLAVGGAGSEFTPPKPIQLTEEWHDRIENEYTFETFGGYVFVGILDDDDYMIDEKLLKYLHQWQNLYNSLTGRELTIK